MTANNANLIIATLVNAEGKKVELTGSMKNKDMLAALEAAGSKIGATTLRELISGKKESAGGWSLMKPEAGNAADDGAVKELVAADQGAQTDQTPSQPLNIAQMQQEAKNAAPKQLTPEQLALAANVENAMPSADSKLAKVAGTDFTGKIDPATGKQTFRGTDWTKVLPQSPVPIKQDSMLHRLFVRLCDPAGVTKKQMLDEFSWSAGGLSGILHWEPKAKGYFLASEKKEGALYYYLAEIGTGRRYSPEEILIKAAPAPKAPKEPKAPKVQAAAAADATKAPKVSKEQRAQVPNLGAANVTKRVANKKPV